MRYIINQDVHLYHDDCLKILPTLPNQCVDLIVTDPPYGTTSCRWDTVIPLPEMWKQLKRIIKPNGAILLMAQTPFDKVLGSSNLEMLRYEWIWQKTQASGHLNAKKAPLKSHENILVFYFKQPTYNPIKTTGHIRKTAVKRKDITEVYGKQKFSALAYDSTERYPRSVLTFSSDKQKSTLHPTQKPLSLMEYLIKTYSNNNDLVLDFTMGSGTTGVAAIKLDRRFIGVEIDAIYFETAKNRILEAVSNI